MRTFRNRLITLVVVGALAILGTFMNSHQAIVQGAGGPTVTIDPSQLPLQVTGSTTIAGTVAASQSGSWTFRDQDNPGRHAFAATCSAPAPSSPIYNEGCTIPIPAGVEYVIQNVTVSLSAINATGVMTTILTTVGGTNSAALFQPISQIIASGFVGQTYNIVAYGDPGTNVSCQVFGVSVIPNTANLTDFSCNIQGYKVTLP